MSLTAATRCSRTLSTRYRPTPKLLASSLVFLYMGPINTVLQSASPRRHMSNGFAVAYPGAPRPKATARPQLQPQEEPQLGLDRDGTNKQANKQKDHPPWNEDIPFALVHVIDAETNKLGELESLTELLARTNTKQMVVQLMSKTPPAVRIFDRRELKEMYKERKASNKENRVRPRKEIQFSWGISRGDLDIKVSKARAELDKRTPVDIILQHRKKQEVEMDQRDQVVQYIKDGLAEHGVYRRMESGPSRTTLIFDLTASR
ncbi:hypothetical protein BKA62DRAFT_689313 [Auriculariales sp. MPI-PUGE-AT-0066]|nr:hypothetical protein BKA62DRAFT_689313 [Auriculariales sp. MPI-PUGE-AT-0066]